MMRPDRDAVRAIRTCRRSVVTPFDCAIESLVGYVQLLTQPPTAPARRPRIVDCIAVRVVMFLPRFRWRDSEEKGWDHYQRQSERLHDW